MPLKVVSYAKSSNWYLRGTVRGVSIFETTKTDDRKRAEEIRAIREAQILEETVHGRSATATFFEAAEKYLQSGGQGKYLGHFDDATRRWTGLLGEFAADRLSSITQDRLDAVARKLYPEAAAETRNRQVYTPFVAIWN